MTAVKTYLHITWQDTGTDTNLTGMINRGEARLQEIAGVPLDFEAEEQPRALLLDYCRYANSHALEMFERNFGAELLSLHINGQVQAESDEEAAATAAVVAAEGSLLLADYDAAETLVEGLIETAVKTDLTARLAAIAGEVIL